MTGVLVALMLAQLAVAGRLCWLLGRARRDLAQRDRWLAGYRLTVGRLAGRLVAWRLEAKDVARWEQEWL